ncbi:MAG TPA: maleylpyruvate isomerase family mycothiol-dependent enzyme [Acidimicrobiia bacterium]
MIDAERKDFAGLCDALTADQWNAASLCSAWRVRDVTSHVVEVATLSGLQLFARLPRYGFRLNAMIEHEAIKHGNATSPEALCAEIRTLVGLRRALPGVKPPGVLAGEMIHQQDIRRALHIDRSIDPARVEIALLDVNGTSAKILPGKKRAAGLFLHAIDVDWQTGESSSPEVAGTGEALLMAMAGRGTALADLTGTGVDTMRARM